MVKLSLSSYECEVKKYQTYFKLLTGKLKKQNVDPES